MHEKLKAKEACGPCGHVHGHEMGTQALVLSGLSRAAEAVSPPAPSSEARRSELFTRSHHQGSHRKGSCFRPNKCAVRIFLWVDNLFLVLCRTVFFLSQR